MFNIDSESFVNPETTNEFICAICLCVPLEPKRHGQRFITFEHSRNICSLIFCIPCATQYIEHSRSDVFFNGRAYNSVPCPQKCGGNMINSDGSFNFIGLPFDSMKRLSSLLVYCPHCGNTISHGKFASHVAHCDHNQANCSTCGIVKNQDHNCQTYIDSLHTKIDSLMEQLKRKERGRRRNQRPPIIRSVTPLFNINQTERPMSRPAPLNQSASRPFPEAEEYNILDGARIVLDRMNNNNTPRISANPINPTTFFDVASVDMPINESRQTNSSPSSNSTVRRMSFPVRTIDHYSNSRISESAFRELFSYNR